MSRALLTLAGVAAERGGRRLFDAVDLTLAAGGAAAVTGPNGAGKSTLLRIAAGLLAPAAGRVVRSARTAWLGEANALDRELPLARALAFWAAADAIGRVAVRVEAGLSAVGLSALGDVPVRLLSTGQRRRAALARVVASEAELWLLDEPANGLDTAATAMLETAIEQRRESGGAVLVATHLPLALPAAAAIALGGGGMIAVLIARDVRQAWASGGAVLPVAFFLLVAILFPFAVGPDTALLARVGGGVIWAAALLAALLPVERLVGPDLDGGIVDQLLVRGASPAGVAVAKTVAHWLGFAPPLMLAAVVAAGLLGLPGETLLRVELGLLIATPALAALAVATGALVAGMRGAGAVAGLAMLPLAVPLLIFGAGALDGGPAAFKLLAAVSLLLCAGSPAVAGAAIRAGQS